MTIDFDPVAHRYRIDGKPVPSVTQVLTDVLGDPTNGWGEKYHLDRGSAAHALYAMMARVEDLSLYDYDQRLAGHVAAWQAWRDAERPEFVEIEKPVAHAGYGYAGTLDALCMIGGRLVLIDYKQASGPRDLIQMAAYALAWESTGGSIAAGTCILEFRSLQIDGAGWRYGDQVRGYRMGSALSDWRAVLRVRQIKQAGQSGGKAQ